MCREGHTPKTPQHTLQQLWIHLMSTQTLNLQTISEQELQNASGGLYFGGATVMRAQAARIVEINQGRGNLAVGAQSPLPYSWPPLA